jgi:hypothetical protein
LSAQNKASELTVQPKNQANSRGPRLNFTSKIVIAGLTFVLETEKPIDGILPRKSKIVIRLSFQEK